MHNNTQSIHTSNMFEKLIIQLLESIEPQHFALCIEHDLYIFNSIAYALQKTHNELEQEIITKYNVDKEEAQRLIKALRMNTMMINIFRLVHQMITRLRLGNLINRLDVETAERLLEKYAPALFEVYKRYGEKGKRWLQNEIEYDLKPFLLGKDNNKNNKKGL